MTLIEDGKMITKNSEMAEVFSNVFINIMEYLGISTAELFLLPTNNVLESIDTALKKFQLQSSVCKIKE